MGWSGAVSGGVPPPERDVQPSGERHRHSGSSSGEAGQASPWTVDRMGARYAQLREHIVAFRAHVHAVSATFKLGQDESPGTFAEIVAGHGDAQLVSWMQRFRQD